MLTLLPPGVSLGMTREAGQPSEAAPSAKQEALAASTNREDSAASTEVWLCTGQGVLDLPARDAQWPFVREHLSGIQFYIDMIDRATPEQLGQLVRLIRRQGYQVSVECGGTLDFAPMDETNGEVSARIELARLAKFYAAGGRVDFLNRDGPVRTAPEAPALRTLERISYGREAPQAQMLNAYLVHRNKPATAIIQILSGGWNSAPPQRVNLEPFKPCLDAGISIIVAAHRPIGKDIHWPVPCDDIARAVQFVRSRAGEWGIDPNRIARKGRASGGHLALMVGFGPDQANRASADPVERQSSRPNRLVAGAAPTDLVLQMSELLKDSDRQAYLWERMLALVGATGEISRDEPLARLKPFRPSST